MNRFLFALALLWILILAGAALSASWISPRDPSAIDLQHILEAPSRLHGLGTDELGRDLLSRMIYGARISLAVGLIAVLVATLLGVLVGSLGGYFGGWVDRTAMALVDVMLCFPTYFLILALIALLEPSLWHIMVIIGCTGWMGTARLVRAEILSLKEREFILAARGLGASSLRIIIIHLLPHALGPVKVTAILGIANAILIESALSFLGIGVQPPTPSWGNILTDGKSSLGAAWWPMLFPGLAILLTVLSYNVIGEFLGEPRPRGPGSKEAG